MLLLLDSMEIFHKLTSLSIQYILFSYFSFFLLRFKRNKRQNLREKHQQIFFFGTHSGKNNVDFILEA